MSELKAINAYQLTTNTEDSDVYIHNDEFGCGGDLVDCYLKSKVDTAIAELKDAWRSEHAACEALKAKLESVQASAYADSVDAGMRERRLRRALWIARAKRASETQQLFLFSRDYDKLCIDGFFDPYSGRRELSPIQWVKVFNKVENKCLKKVEEYR